MGQSKTVLMTVEVHDHTSADKVQRGAYGMV